MSAEPGILAEGVRLLRQAQLDADFAGGLGRQRLAEMTHLPTGAASEQFELVSVHPGDAPGTQAVATTSVFIHVVAGQLRVTWGRNLDNPVPAGPGDTLFVPAGTRFRADNAQPSTALQFIIFRAGD